MHNLLKITIYCIGYSVPGVGNSAACYTVVKVSRCMCVFKSSIAVRENLLETAVAIR
jgi:hypothetical protein